MTRALPRLWASAAGAVVVASAWGAEPAARAQLPPARPSDTVYLNDGTALRGMILGREPGRYVLLLGPGGARTIPWSEVARIDDAAAPLDGSSGAIVAPSSPQPTTGLPARRGGPEEDDADRGLSPVLDDGAPWPRASLGWDLRLEGSALWKHYASSSRGSWFGGGGAGAGISASLHFRSPASVDGGGGVRWLDFELGAGDATHFESWNEESGLHGSFVETEVSAIAGAHWATGRWAGRDAERWSGVVVGLAWVPTYVVFFGNGDFDSAGKFNPAGVRLTVDVGPVVRRGIVGAPAARAFLTWLPYVSSAPTALSAGVGCVFY